MSDDQRRNDVGRVVGIFVCPEKGDPMRELGEVHAVEGTGLQGDRYCLGVGSFSSASGGNRQVTLISARWFPESGFTYADSRRNLIVSPEVELMYLIGREFQVGDAWFKGEKYCEPCERPDKLADKERGAFKRAFFDRAGIVATVTAGGRICLNSRVVPPRKSYK